jgi:hypothetical protein
VGGSLASCAHDSNGRFSVRRRCGLLTPCLAGLTSIIPHSTATAQHLHRIEESTTTPSGSMTTSLTQRASQLSPTTRLRFAAPKDAAKLTESERSELKEASGLLHVARRRTKTHGAGSGSALRACYVFEDWKLLI